MCVCPLLLSSSNVLFCNDDEGLSIIFQIHDKLDWMTLVQLSAVFDGAVNDILLTWILASGKPIFSASLSRANTSG